MIKNGIFLILITLAAPAYGIVYSWLDSAGIEHYTNKQYEIPDRYRAKVKARYPEQGDSNALQQNVLITPTVPETSSPKSSQQAKPEEPSMHKPSIIQSEVQKKPVVRTSRRGSRGRSTSDDE